MLGNSLLWGGEAVFDLLDETSEVFKTRTNTKMGKVGCQGTIFQGTLILRVRQMQEPP
jgi:hypothetical protein